MENGIEKVEVSGFYNGHSAKGNFDIELKLLFRENEVIKALQFITGIGNRILLIAKSAHLEESIKLGTFGFNNLRVDKDANLYLSLRANQEFVFVNNITRLMLEDEFTFIAKIIPG